MKRLLMVSRALIAVGALFFVPYVMAEDTAAPVAADTGAPAATAPAMPAAVEAVQAAKEDANQPKTISIYGEIQSVDAAANTFNVQYYDYDSDEEKKIDISVGKDTKLENAASLNDMKRSDWADVTYTVADGKNVATVVSVEKEEAEPASAGKAAEAPAAGADE